MAKKQELEIRDIDECKEKINALLREYNCELLDPDEGKHVLIWDKDTNEMDSVYC